MEVILIILAALVVVAIPLYISHRRQETKNGGEIPVTEPEQKCCGLHLACEKDSLLAAVSDKIEYYDDEELDAFIGRDAQSYTDAETEQFRDVLVTMLPQDIAGWARSLQLRGIEIPQIIRDELLMVVAEARAAATRHSAD